MTVQSSPMIEGLGFSVPPELRGVLDEIRAFVAEDAIPAEAELADPDDILASWHVVERLRDRARERGIYAPGQPEEWGGLGIGVVGMSLISQECGVSPLASLGLNAMAPDEGNMHTLLLAGTDAQKERWLRPLVEGTIRSCFAMTEPDVASSDPTNLAATAVRDGDEWVLNGRKWFITGAIGATIAIVVAKTGGLDDPDPDRRGSHRDYSLILVPCDTPGWEIVRDPEITGAHMVGGHAEIRMTDVRVPVENLLGGEGEGFVISQKRLAGGRLAHAMRWIGVSQRALDLTAARLKERQAFGVDLAKHQALQFFIADSAIDLYASRMMVLNAAWKVEHDLPHRQEIAMVKTFVAEAFGRILDRCVQIYGSHGISTEDFPIARWYADSRAARIYDGASEVHRMTIARTLLKLADDGGSTASGCGAIE
ncbi:acyl-CoA dehydrogenase family protein [Patulibacter minatonensis]|uniref:acyl-CoA dehydrogenase family protein n=1 Tax=Patulibacter minatonensis TaxID=298163 RepID=UPI000686204D|nr:acyl-CoA dehydrogenase family protein [Patulibacter minatonensis]